MTNYTYNLISHSFRKQRIKESESPAFEHDAEHDVGGGRMFALIVKGWKWRVNKWQESECKWVKVNESEWKWIKVNES